MSAQDCLDRGSVETARAILQHAISVFPGKKSLYRALAHLERQHGTPEAVAEVLERGVKYCPQVPFPLCSQYLCGFSTAEVNVPVFHHFAPCLMRLRRKRWSHLGSQSADPCCWAARRLQVHECATNAAMAELTESYW